ncbi:MAG: OB-fold nucleic acid binding domain-containing protein, partial [Solirubrobacteraceae bacterium]
RAGLAEFFLICWDLMRFAKSQGIPAQGRGSAGDSVVAYVLGITRVDPIRHRLLFERFINEGRTTYPDVDIDFASSRREEVIQYVYDKYGPDHTGMVCNVVTYRARSAVREVGYALGFPRPLVDRVAKALETYDSVMVRRDLEAEGGFAEFFQGAVGLAPLASPWARPARLAGEPDQLAGERSDQAEGIAASGSSTATGGSLSTAVATATAVAATEKTEATRVADDRARAMGFIDGMGELQHRRGGRIATGGAGENGIGRMGRKEDDRTEGGKRGDSGKRAATAGRATNSAAEATRPPGLTRIVDLMPRLAERLDDSLAPRTELRPGPSDDEGGPGDTPASVRWLRAESEWKRMGRGGSASAAERAPGMIDGRRLDPGSGVLLPADRRADGAARHLPAERHLPADGAAERRIQETSLGAIELDPLPADRPSRSTVGMSPWDRWLELCARIDGFPRHLSIHVGGMLVTAAPLVDIAPLERATMPGRVVVQYDKRDVETLKLIKLDLLGLRMLSAIDDALRDIAVDCAVHIDLDRLPEDIPEVFRMICAADTVGVFQIESRAQMQTLPKSRPATLDDLVVEVAIIRPGPIQGNAVHPYLRRRQGLEPVTYLHPSLEPILAETLGVILYQEQVMKVAIDVAGYTAAESDGFRRAMGTWRSTREMEKLHAKFVDGCVEVSGLTREDAEELYTRVAGFASFGFNKSHAAAFARTAYESSFLKLFYPAQFVTGLINAQPMGFYPVEVLINDAKRHGVAVLPVDVNRSRFRTTTEWAGMDGEPLPDGAGIVRRPVVVRSPSCVVPGKEARDRFAAPSAPGYGIRLGLHLVKGIGEAEGEALDAELSRGGPYRSLADLVARTEISEEVIERLIRAGALDSLRRPRRELLWQLREVAGAARGRYDGRAVSSRKAQGRPLDLRLPPTDAPDLPPPTELERLGDAYAILSLDARRQVVELFRPALHRLGAVANSRLDTLAPGRVALGGLVVTRQHPMTARGTVFLALEDETGMVNVTLWPDAWARLRGVVRRHALLYVEGTLQREANVVNVIARRILPLTEVARAAGGPEGPEGVRHMGQAGMRRLG